MTRVDEGDTHERSAHVPDLTPSLPAHDRRARRREPPRGRRAPARPARAQGSLKGTKLTIIAGDWYVPETNKMLDELVASLAKDTGMDVRVERFAGEQQVAKVAGHRGSGRGGDIAVVRDIDAYLYGDKLIDVTDVAERDRQDVRRLVRRRQAGRAW